ncbi:phospho-N-acetylmuramoyl-pentapeptide-transferase [candidate division WOR-3 bacterium]|nr:phospho-N-acetylmuramoyl-pentapeptide-transferase [candidate division WOR-3 bacterium]
MLYLLLLPLREAFGPLNIVRYITFRSACAGAVSILLVLLFGPPLIRLVRRLNLGQRIREEVPERHRGKAGTPTMGGVLILAAGIVAVLLFADLRNRQVQLGLLVAFWLGLLGFVDDYVKVKLGNPRGISKTVKLVGQFGLALFVGAVLYFIPVDPQNRSTTNVLLFKNLVVQFGWFYVPFVMLVLVATSNAVNLADGVDGLAAGLATVAFASFAVLSYVSGHIRHAHYLNIMFIPTGGEMTVFCLAMVGACLGFLWFNAFPAQVFMGDTGSLPLGGLLGLAAVLCKHEILLPIVGGVLVLETGATLLQIGHFHLTGGKRLFRMAPLHHHFELAGWSEPQIVTRFMILAVLFAFAGLATLKVR